MLSIPIYLNNFLLSEDINFSIGVIKEALKTYIGVNLYSAQYLSPEEIQNLNNYKNYRKIDLPMCIIFSKGFLSFSKDINES